MKTHDDIRNQLRELGFDSRDLNHAIRLFQKAHRIPLTGQADDLTMRNLFGSPQPVAPERVPLIHPDWKKLLRHAWSVRLMAASVVFQTLEQVLPYLQDIPFIPRGVLAILATISVAGGLLMRFVPQKEFTNADQ